MEIIKRNPKELIKADYNPRKISDKDFKQLKKSLETFQCVEPIVVNQFEGRENVIVGGHQRLKAMESLGWSEVPTIEVYLDLDEEKELNVRLNKNTGEFDFDLLEEFFDKDLLKSVGFEFDDQIVLSDEDKKEEEIKFSTELDEQSNYIVLKFDTDIDWLHLQSLFMLESTYSKRSNGKPWSKGVGRVVNGVKFLNELGVKNEN
jgi:ParB-like chromosome segregation protein Spo0J